MNIGDLLREEVRDELTNLKDINKDTAEYRVAVDGITKLTDRVIEFEKINMEKEEKARSREAAKEQAEFERKLKEKQVEEEAAQAEFERKLKLKEMLDDQKDRWVKNGLTLIGIVLPLGLTVWGTYKSFEFEKEGTITTIMGRGYINKMLPKK